MNFKFATTNRIIFGPGSINQVAPLALEYGSNPLVVTGKSLERAEQLLEHFKRSNIKPSIYSVTGEPTTITIRECVQLSRKNECDVIIGIGGGSTIDTGKAAAALMTNEGDLLDYLEVIGQGKKLKNPSAPFIAVPTTAGTGAEVTRNAVIAYPEHKVKVSLRSHFLLPEIAVVDPLLTHSMPPSITAYTGLDAFTQVIEPYVSNKANPITDSLCREGIKRISRSLLRVYRNGSDSTSREDMCIGSLFGGLTLANAKLGAVHGFAGPMGGMIGAPHGAICGTLLPPVIKANIEALKSREPDSSALLHYDEIAGIITDNSKATSMDLIDWITELYENIKLPKLSELGLKDEQINKLIEKAKKASSMKGNPIQLTDAELKEIIKSTF